MKSCFTATATVSFLLFAIAGIRCDAQVVQFRGGGDAKQIKQQLEAQINAQKQAAERTIAVRIDDINRVCKLSDSQLKKIRIAAKGAVAKVVGTAREQMEATLKQIQGGQPADGRLQAFQVQVDNVIDEDANADEEDARENKDEDSEEDEDEDEDNAPANVAPQVVANNVFFFAGGPGGGFGGMQPGMQPDSSVEQQKVWINSLQKILTPEQSKKYDAELKSRDKYQRQLAVERFVAKIDRRLLLSAEQRETLTKLIDKNFGDKLKEREKATGTVGWIQQMGRRKKPDIGEDKLEFLSEVQLAEWRNSIEPELKQISQMAIRGGVPMPQPIRLAAPDRRFIEVVEDEKKDDEEKEDKKKDD